MLPLHPWPRKLHPEPAETVECMNATDELQHDRASLNLQGEFLGVTAIACYSIANTVERTRTWWENWW